MITHIIESYWNPKSKLEQLERLRSGDTPAASWLPIPLSHIGSQVKRRQSQSYKFKEFAKISSDEYCWRYRADTILSTDGQGETSIPYPPFNFVEAGGVITNQPEENKEKR